MPKEKCVEEFLYKHFSSHLVKFKGDSPPFHGCEEMIDQYFKI